MEKRNRKLQNKLLVRIILICIVVSVLTGSILKSLESKLLMSQSTDRLNLISKRYKDALEEEISNKLKVGIAANKTVFNGLSLNRQGSIELQAGKDGAVRHSDGYSGAFLSNLNELTEDIKHVFMSTENIWQYTAPVVTESFFNFYIITKDNFLRITPPEWAFEAEADHNFVYDIFYSVADSENNPEKQPKWTPVYYDSIWKKWMTSLIIPLYKDDVFIGITGSDFILDDLFSKINNLSKTEGWGEAFLSDSMGNLIAHPDYMKVILEKSAKMNTQLKSTDISDSELSHFISDIGRGLIKENRIIQYKEHGKPHFAVVRPIKEMDWYLTVAVEENDLIEVSNVIHWTIYITAILFGLLLAITLKMSFRKLILQPIDKLDRAAKSLTKGDWDYPMEIESNDEFGSLAGSFQDMASQLKKSFHDMDDLNKKLESKVVERTEQIKRSFEVQHVISSVLKLSFKNLELREYLELALDLLFSVPWLSAKSIGCIFLFDPHTNTLKMTVRRNFPQQLLQPCKEVPLGKCLCGLAASSGEMVFADKIDERHEILYEGIPPHGHYCIPIKTKEKLLGLLNIDLNEGHERNHVEEQFLQTFADTLATIIERSRTHEKLEFMANYDPLTALPNRSLLFDRLNQAIKESQRYGDKITIMYIDLDRFKCVNDTYGHEVGDMLLKTTASRLLECVRDTDTVSRVGGDEFVLVVTRMKDSENSKKIAKKIIDSLSKPLIINDHSCSIIVSIGMSFFPEDGHDMQMLIKKADTAMYHAKTSGGHNVIAYNNSMDKELRESSKLEQDIRHALANDEFVLHYQPQINLRTGLITGAEALIRWNHPIFGMIYPDKFISIAESLGLIVQIGDWVLQQGCLQSKMWQQNYSHTLVLAVNISYNQFQQYNFSERVSQILFETELDPQLLELELTESVSMHNMESTIYILKELNSIGVKLAIDDFGTGYSSLSYLKHLPFHKLKIDKSFINDINHNNDDHVIAKTIIDMAHNLGLKVIAEGVETKEQLEILKKLDCDEVQGYLISKPVREEDFLSLLQSR